MHCSRHSVPKIFTWLLSTKSMPADTYKKNQPTIPALVWEQSTMILLHAFGHSHHHREEPFQLRSSGPEPGNWDGGVSLQIGAIVDIRGQFSGSIILHLQLTFCNRRRFSARKTGKKKYERRTTPRWTSKKKSAHFEAIVSDSSPSSLLDADAGDARRRRRVFGAASKEAEKLNLFDPAMTPFIIP